jgi:hypothetical protein
MKSFVILCIATISQAAFAGSFTHRLSYFGQLSTIEACRSEMVEVAQKFSAAAGVEVLGADCVKSEYYSGGIDGEILYIAPNRVVVTNSDARDRMQFDGYYASISACQSGIQREDPIFRQQTSLTPYVAYCYRASSIGPAVYRSRIEAVGTSEIKKFSTYSDYFDAPLNAELLLQTSRQIAENIGLVLVESAMDRDNSGWHIAMDYYASEKYYIHADEKLNFQTDAECLSAASDAQQSWTLQALPIIFSCTKSGRFFGLNHIWFTKQLFSESDFTTKILPIAYGSIDQCIEQKAAVIEKLTSAGSNIAGSACGLKEGQPRLLIFEVKESGVN